MSRKLSNSLLTLIVPTKNRWPYLERLLRFYADGASPYPVMVGDSSEGHEREASNRTLAALSARLSIEYFHVPGMTAFAAARHLLEKVDTPYVAFVADDDYVLPGGLDRAVQFLDAHKDYTVAHGHALLFGLDSDGPYGKIQWLVPYQQRSIEQESASVRIVDHLGNYSPTIFSVHRTPPLLESYRIASSLDLDQNFGEYLPSSLPIVLGKVKKLDTLYMVRQAHSRMDSRTSPDVFDWICKDTWSRQWVGFRDCLATAIAEVDGISLDKAQAVVKQALWACIGKAMIKKWQQRYGKNHSSLHSRLARLAAEHRELYRRWQNLLSVIPSERNQFLLPALLRESSPYHLDFEPVYVSVNLNRKGPDSE